MEIMKPADIERRSMEIIDCELASRGIALPADVLPIVRRVIHTTADFDYAQSLRFTPDAVRLGLSALRGGVIVTDTNMALAGINKRMLASFGSEAMCFMADESVMKEAKERQVTRAHVSMERAMRIDRPVIFAIGNAPTALITLREYYDLGKYRPAFVIGVPVGFVNVAEAKELIIETEIPHIINRGRKGGSNVAAAICNAMLYEMRERI